MYVGNVLFSRELHKDELSRGLQNLTRYSNRYIHIYDTQRFCSGCNEWVTDAGSSEYQINGEKRNLDVLITGSLVGKGASSPLLFSFFSRDFHPSPVISVRLAGESQFARIFLNGQSHLDRVNRVNNNVGNGAHSDLPPLFPADLPI